MQIYSKLALLNRYNLLKCYYYNLVFFRESINIVTVRDNYVYRLDAEILFREREIKALDYNVEKLKEDYMNWSSGAVVFVEKDGVKSCYLNIKDAAEKTDWQDFEIKSNMYQGTKKFLGKWIKLRDYIK